MRLYFANVPLFAANGAEVTSRTGVIQTSYGRPVALEVYIDVKGYLEASGQAALTLMENAIRLAFASGYGDLTLRQDSGANSGMALISNSCISGVRIIDGPTFDEAQGAEYVNRRTVKFTGMARVTIRGTENAIMSFEETISIQGTVGDPVINWRHAVNASPIPQVVYPSSTMKVIQSGRAVGHIVRPNPAVPIWGTTPPEQRGQRRIVQEAGRRVGPGAGAIVEPAVSWTYVFEDSRPLIALPSIPPV